MSAYKHRAVTNERLDKGLNFKDSKRRLAQSGTQVLVESYLVRKFLLRYPRTLNDRIYVKTSKMPTRDFCTKSVCSSCGAVEQSRNFPYAENTTRVTGCSNGGSRTWLFPWAAVAYFDVTAASFLTSNWSVDRTETEAELSPVTCKIFRHT